RARQVDHRGTQGISPRQYAPRAECRLTVGSGRATPCPPSIRSLESTEVDGYVGERLTAAVCERRGDSGRRADAMRLRGRRQAQQRAAAGCMSDRRPLDRFVMRGWRAKGFVETTSVEHLAPSRPPVGLGRSLAIDG